MSIALDRATTQIIPVQHTLRSHEMSTLKRSTQVLGMAISALLLLALTVSPTFACGKGHP